MCLIVLAWQSHPRIPLLLAGNRDEYYGRATAPAAPWEDLPWVTGGRDLTAGGTWLAADTGVAGRFAAVTNVREPGRPPGRLSRGQLPRDFLAQREMGARAYAEAITRRNQEDAGAWSGYNLLLGDGQELVYVSNRSPGPQVLSPGIYGLSNRSLDTPWPKLRKSRAGLARCLEQETWGLGEDGAARETLFTLLGDTEPAADGELPDTGVGLAWERTLSPVFIRSPDYGTRATTLLYWDQEGRYGLEERSFGPAGESGRRVLQGKACWPPRHPR